MKHTSQLTARMLAIVLIVGIVCPLSSSAQVQARVASPTLVERAHDSEPIKNRQVLRAKLNISAERAEAIFVGRRGKARVSRFLAADSGDTKYTCTEHGCSCHGDDDCNLMFTQVCADPATNGSCTGEVCTCTP